MKVESSLISEVLYNPKTKEMSVIFKDRGEPSKYKYVYSEVPAEEFNDMISASSVGVYFFENIKGSYDFVKSKICP
jgi:predicted transcriptional regulator